MCVGFSALGGGRRIWADGLDLGLDEVGTGVERDRMDTRRKKVTFTKMRRIKKMMRSSCLVGESEVRAAMVVDQIESDE